MFLFLITSSTSVSKGNSLLEFGTVFVLFTGTVLVLKTITILSYPILDSTSSILHPTYCILHPTSSILHPTSSIPHPTVNIQHSKSSILHPASYIKILSNPILSNKNIEYYISLNQYTMLTNDYIMYSLGHLCNKESVNTNCLFLVSF